MSPYMSTFKAELYDICKEVSAGFAGWTFVSGHFKNKTLSHTDLVIHLGFSFEHGTTPVQPSVAVENKKAQKLCKQIFGTHGPTSIVNLQVVAHTLESTVERLRLGYWIVQDRKDFLLKLRLTKMPLGVR